MIAHDAPGLFDRGFGPYLLPVTPPDGTPSPHPATPLTPAVMGKAPGIPTDWGWVPVSVKDTRHRCHSLKTAKLWHETWGANVGFAVGDGYVFIDNDEGEETSHAIRQVLVDAGVTPFRRYVFSPKHKRDAFLLRVLNFVGEPADLSNQNFILRKGTLNGKIQILAYHVQAVVAGTHKGTRCPYVWDCDIGDLEADVPVISDKKFDTTIRNLVELLTKDGWTVTGGHAGTARVPAAAPQAGNVAIAMSTDAIAIKNAIDHMRELLALLPNRELPLDPKDQTIADKWLDDYDNWKTVPYRIAAQLGRPIALTPDALDLWLEWVNARPQGQDVAGMWQSVLNQPGWLYGSIAVDKLIDELQARPKPPEFPPVDPNDPMLKVAPTPVWDSIAQEWALFLPGGFLHLPSGGIVSRTSFSDRHSPRLFELLAELQPSRKKRDKLPRVADLFVAQPNKLVVSRLDYAPGESLFYDDPKHTGTCVYNRWRPTEAVARPVQETTILPWLDHVEFLLGSRAERELFVKWCAFNAQCPKDKSNWHYLVMSVPGLGKDLMLLPVRLAIGAQNAKEAEAAQLVESFNDPFEAKLLVVNELRQPVNKDARMLWNRLKHAMAAPPEHIHINSKYQQRAAIPNRIAFILFANDFNPLALDADDRRLYVRNQRHLQPRDKKYYDDLRTWLVNGGQDDAAAYLLTLPLTDADKALFRGVAPTSPDKSLLISMNMDPLEDAILAIMQEVQDGKRVPLIELDTLTELLAVKGARWVQSSRVRGCLLDLERRGKGAGRVRVNPAKPDHCAAISSKGTAARLWYLGPAPNGQPWNTLGDAAVISIWKGKGLPPSAKVMGFPGTTQDTTGDEPV